MMRCGSVGLILLAAACFVIGAVAVAIPYWGHFRNRVVQETGNFGPWTICRDIDYGRKTCGARIVMFKPSFRVYAAGVLSALGVAGLGVYGLLTIFYMTLMCSPNSSLRRHKVYILITKLILSLISALTAWTAVGLFASQGDDLEHGYIITVGFSFYMEIVVALFSTILMLLTIAEYVSARREPDHVTDSAQGRDIGLKNVITNPALAYSRDNRGGGDHRDGRRSPSSTNVDNMHLYKSRSVPVIYIPGGVENDRKQQQRWNNNNANSKYYHHNTTGNSSNSKHSQYYPSVGEAAGEPLLGKKHGGGKDRRGSGGGEGFGANSQSRTSIRSGSGWSPRSSRRRRDSGLSRSRASSCSSLNGSIRDSTIPRTFSRLSRTSSVSSLTGSIRDSTIPRTGLEVIDSFRSSRRSPYI